MRTPWRGMGCGGRGAFWILVRHRLMALRSGD